MKPTERVERRVRKLTEHWRVALDLDRLVWIDEYIHGSDPEDSNCLASTVASWEYMQARVRWYLEPMASLTNDQIEQVVLHEHAHVLVAPMERDLMDSGDAYKAKLCEFTVEGLGRVLFKLSR